MKILFKLLLLIILPIIFAISIFYAANNGKLDRQIKYGLKYYLKLQNIDASFSDFKFRNGSFVAKKINAKMGMNQAIISNLQIETNIFGKWNNLQINFDIKIEDFLIIDKDNNKLIQTNLSGKIGKYLFSTGDFYELSANNINIFSEHVAPDNKLENGKAEFNYFTGQYNKEKYTNIDGFLKFGKSDILNITNSKKSNQIRIDMYEIPIMLYSIIYQISEDDKFLEFLRSFIKSGYVQEGVILLDPSVDISTEKGLSGNVKINQLELSYDSDLPRLKDMELDIVIKGSKIQFHINQAYSSDVRLSDGLIDMDWKGVDDTVLIITAKGEGSAVSLTDFIPETEHKILSRANIDLRKVKGIVDVNVFIKIPLKKNSKNIYNITADLPKSSLTIFNNHIKLNDAKISGVFNGNQVMLNGVGKINGFNSDINFICNIEDQSEFSHKLDIKTNLKAPSNKISFTRLVGGDSVIDINYINKDSKGFLSVNSDISNLDLYFDSLGVHKARKDEAKIVIDGIFTDPENGFINFSLTGEKNLLIQGDILIKEDNVEANIKEIKNKETDLSANILLNKGLFVVDLSGQILDLSDSDIKNILIARNNENQTRILLNIDQVKLKNDILLNDFKMQLECDKTRCYSGFLDSKLGSRFVEMLLIADGNNEKWLIKCNNAGALLKGTGVYTAMKSGNLIVNINTSRKKLSSEKTASILDGDFNFERFVLVDTPIMSKIVSLASLPGILNAISGNKNVVFTGLKGNFSFFNNILTIKNSRAEGPYFDFTLKGDIDVNNRIIDIKGTITPELYGVTSLVGGIPIFGKILKGTKNNSGIISKSYRLKDSY